MKITEPLGNPKEEETEVKVIAVLDSFKGEIAGTKEAVTLGNPRDETIETERIATLGNPRGATTEAEETGTLGNPRATGIPDAPKGNILGTGRPDMEAQDISGPPDTKKTWIANAPMGIMAMEDAPLIMTGGMRGTEATGTRRIPTLTRLGTRTAVGLTLDTSDLVLGGLPGVPRDSQTRPKVVRTSRKRSNG